MRSNRHGIIQSRESNDIWDFGNLLQVSNSLLQCPMFLLKHSLRSSLIRLREWSLISVGRIAAIKASRGGIDHGWARYEDAVKEALAKLPPSAVFNANEPAPYTQEGSVVFVCIDVEAYERNTRIITEIGVSTLDTNDLKSLVPGEGGVEWMKKIRARHFRINENKHYNNTDFVAGCADRFEFG